MNKEEFIGKLQMCYFGERNAFDEIVSEFDRLNNIINEVRKYIEKTKFKYCGDELCYMIENHYNNILEILDKGEELEKRYEKQDI